MAIEIGVGATASRLGVNRKTARVWRNRLLEGEAFDSKGAPPLTEDEIMRVKKYIAQNGLVPLSKIQERVLPTRSKASIYKILLAMNIPVTVPRIVRFDCNFCNENPIALQIYFGVTKKPPCPNCKKRLSYISSNPLKIIGKIDSLLILKEGLLFPPRNDDIALLEKNLQHTDSEFPLYCRDLVQHPHPLLHMVSGIETNVIHTLCKIIIIKGGSLLSATADEIRRNWVCIGCLLQANEMLNKGKPLKPIIMPRIISKREKILEAVSLAFTIKNIKRACDFHKISRTTFYKYIHSLGLKDSFERMRHHRLS